MRSATRLLFAVPFVAALALASIAATDGANAGKALFLSAKCNTCHSITKQSVTATRAGNVVDLSSVGKTRTAAFLAKYLVKNEKINGKKHPVKYQGTAAQLTELSAWLATLK